MLDRRAAKTLPTRYTDEQVRAMLEEPDHWLAHLRRAARQRGASGLESWHCVVAFLRGWLAAKGEAVPEHVEDFSRGDTARLIPGDVAALPRFLTEQDFAEQRRQQGIRTPRARVLAIGNKRPAGGG